MANLTRIVIGNELNSLFKKLDENGKTTPLQYKIYQINGEDKYRIIVHLPGFDCTWNWLGFPEQEE